MILMNNHRSWIRSQQWGKRSKGSSSRCVACRH